MSPRFVRHPIGIFTTLIAAFLFVLGCGTHSKPPTAPLQSSLATSPRSDPLLLVGGGATDPLELAIQVQEKYSSLLMALPGVVGTGATIDDSNRGVVDVLVMNPGLPGIPTLLDGLRVQQVVTGLIEPWAAQLTGTYRPVPIGVSVGNADFSHGCVPGTITCVVERDVDGVEKRYLLSANHVFARQNQAAIGEPIVQPSQVDLPSPCGPYDAPAVIAHLTDFAPVVYDNHTENTMDAAIAEVDPSVATSCSTPDGFYGFPGMAGRLNDGSNRHNDPRAPIRKVGRTTGVTTGTTTAVNVKAKIKYSCGTALFVNQMLTTNDFGDYGDSGALVIVDTSLKIAIGMVIGGNKKGSAIVSPILPILSRFNTYMCNN